MIGPAKVSLRILRQRYPEWTWHPERQGLGYVYRGTREGFRWVRVYRVSEHVGPNADDYQAAWHITTGKRTFPFVLWNGAGEPSDAPDEPITDNVNKG